LKCFEIEADLFYLPKTALKGPPFNLGIGAALRSGFKFVIQNDYDVVDQYDSNEGNPTEHISQLLHLLGTTDADMVIGNRLKTSSFNAIRQLLLLKQTRFQLKHYLLQFSENDF
jgi:hypothetical protein